ncbi:MAG: cytochrome P450 [Gemmatimonadetes bacterium]|nr:cytochrome P450 [Gemmatimonadota bacterium]
MSTLLASAPPGPRARFPGELLARFASLDRLDFMAPLPARYGDVVSWRLGRQRVVLLAHPDDIRDVLVTHQRSFTKGRALQRARRLIGDGLLTSEGEVHLRQRRLVQPAFHRARVARYAETMVRATVAHQEGWRHGAAVDINAEMMRLTMAIVAETLFGADVGDEAERVTRALHDVFASFDLGLSPLAPLLDRLPTSRQRRFQRARRVLDEIVYGMIHARRRAGRDTGDLLSMLLAAQDTEGDGRGMSDQQLRDELLTLFIAGHETTANALSWTWWLLDRHPEVRARLDEELDTVLADRDPTADDVGQLPFTRAVIAESMRLRPPAYIVGRRAIAPYRVRDWELPAGTLVVVSQYITHRDPRWWPEPERFDPARWLAPDDRPRFAYFPFGGGTRVCVGEAFAWTEAVLLLATLARRWRVEVAHPDPRPEPIITLRPRGGMPARLSSRGVCQR